jgi:hypothetical protein
METSSHSIFFVFWLRATPHAVLVTGPRTTPTKKLGVLGVLGV